MAKKSDLPEPSDIITRARKAYEKDNSHWSEIYEKAREDLFFLSDDPYAQWSQKDYTTRIDSGRPALTIDQLGQFVHQVANDIRMNTPSINVIPSGNGADMETANIIKGIIRNIEYVSNADDAYDTAATSAVKCSIGFIRVDHDYVDEDSFNQQLLIKRVTNPLACWIDAESVEPDGRDAKRGLILDRLTLAEFKARYPEKAPMCFETPERRRKSDDEVITIAEYFEIEETERAITVDGMGNVIDWMEGLPATAPKRVVKKKTVHRYKLSGQDVLEQTIFPGEYIPLVPVYGEEAWVDGERNLFSLIRKSKDAQRMFNLWKSLETESLMKQPQAPVQAVEGQIDDYIADWKNPDRAIALRYRLYDERGNILPPPQRLAPPTPPTGFINAANESVDNIKATMGIYNAALGERSNETSGKAINARKVEGDVATYHFGDNLVRSITQVGRILVSAIPSIYDTQQIMRIIGEEDQPKEIGINGAMAPDQERTFDLSQGKYDVRVTTGASFTTQRQEAAQFLSDVATRQPDLLMIMGDLLFKNMDFAGAQAMASRMKKLIAKQNPDVLDDEERADAPPPVDPEKEQMVQVIQQLQAELQAMQAQAQDKSAEMQLKAQTDAQKMELEREKAVLDYEIKMKDLQIKEAELQLKAKDLEIKEMQAQMQPILEMRKQDLGREAAQDKIRASSGTPDNMSALTNSYGE